MEQSNKEYKKQNKRSGEPSMQNSRDKGAPQNTKSGPQTR